MAITATLCVATGAAAASATAGDGAPAASRAAPAMLDLQVPRHYAMTGTVRTDTPGSVTGPASVDAAARAPLSHALDAAMQRDPAVASALAQRQAASHHVDSVNAQKGMQWTARSDASRQQARSNSFETREFNQFNASLNMSMPVFRPQFQSAADQAELLSRSSQVQFRATEQELALRVAQAYFESLSAHTALLAARAQKEAASRQLQSAQRGFDVGTNTVVDVNEAQAKRDAALAQELLAGNEFQIRLSTLSQLTGDPDPTLFAMDEDSPLPRTRPAELGEWLEMMQAENPVLKRSRLEDEIARLEVGRRRAARMPTVDVVGALARSVNPGAQFVGIRQTVGQIGVQVSVPLYDSGVITHDVREATALSSRAAAESDSLQLQQTLETRRLFRRLASASSVVSAMSAAVQSSTTNVESTQRAFQLGLRVSIDVLNAQQALSQARTELARARYEYMLDWLRLHRLAGRLDAQLLAQLDPLLTVPIRKP